MLLWDTIASRGIASTGLSPSTERLSRRFRFLPRDDDMGPQHHIPARSPARIRFALFRFRSPLVTESRLLSFPPLTKMFQFRGFPLLAEYTGKSHSGIPGSKAACASPGHIAACHALLQRPEPSHPPNSADTELLLKPRSVGGHTIARPHMHGKTPCALSAL